MASEISIIGIFLKSRLHELLSGEDTGGVCPALQEGRGLDSSCCLISSRCIGGFNVGAGRWWEDLTAHHHAYIISSAAVRSTSISEAAFPKPKSCTCHI